MSTIGEVHWHEGLFLQPHHLQTMQRYLLDRLGLERGLIFSHAYGLIHMEYSLDALENLQVKFDRLRVAMPSGLLLDVPEQARLPSLSIAEAFKAGTGALTVKLGVPLWYERRANALAEEADPRARRIFCTEVAERPDENTGENTHPITLRRVNARLLLEGDDESDLETVPLLKIVHGTAEEVSMPRPDPEFVPPCLLLRGSKPLLERVQDLVHQVEARRKELALQVSRGGFRIEDLRGGQFEQLSRLRVLNRFAARLAPLIAAPATTPFAVYLELRELLAELAALYPERDPFDAEPYDHDNLSFVFLDLSKRIRPLLAGGGVKRRFERVKFQPEEEYQVARPSAEQLTGGIEYFLGIRSAEDPREVARLVENTEKFKLMPYSLRNRAIFGVDLVMEPVPPQELPAEVGLTYFRVQREDRSARLWERIVEDCCMAIPPWPGSHTSEYKIALYLIRP